MRLNVVLKTFSVSYPCRRVTGGSWWVFETVLMSRRVLRTSLLFWDARGERTVSWNMQTEPSQNSLNDYLTALWIAPIVLGPSARTKLFSGIAGSFGSAPSSSCFSPCSNSTSPVLGSAPTFSYELTTWILADSADASSLRLYSAIFRLFALLNAFEKHLLLTSSVTLAKFLDIYASRS